MTLLPCLLAAAQLALLIRILLFSAPATSAPSAIVLMAVCLVILANAAITLSRTLPLQNVAAIISIGLILALGSWFLLAGWMVGERYRNVVRPVIYVVIILQSRVVARAFLLRAGQGRIIGYQLIALSCILAASIALAGKTLRMFRFDHGNFSESFAELVWLVLLPPAIYFLTLGWWIKRKPLRPDSEPAGWAAFHLFCAGLLLIALS